MYTKMKKAHETGIRYPVIVDAAFSKAYGENTNDFMGYNVLQGISKVRILIDSWHNVKEDLKDAIWENVHVFYELFARC